MKKNKWRRGLKQIKQIKMRVYRRTGKESVIVGMGKNVKRNRQKIKVTPWLMSFIRVLL